MVLLLLRQNNKPRAKATLNSESMFCCDLQTLLKERGDSVDGLFQRKWSRGQGRALKILRASEEVKTCTWCGKFVLSSNDGQ